MNAPIRIGSKKPYGQENPRDQAKVLLGSLEGSISNAQDDIAVQRSLEQALARVEELKQLVDLYMPTEW